MKRVHCLVSWSFFLWISVFGYGQAPGGVSGAQVWFKTTRMPNTLFSWQDFGGDGVTFNNWNTSNQYSNVGRYYNFNASLYLDGGSRQFFLNQTNLEQGTIIGLFAHKDTNFNSENTLFGITGRPNEGALITNDKVVNSTQRDGDILDYGSNSGEDLYRKQDNSEGTDAKFRERSLKIVSYFQYQQPNSSIWGEDQKSNFTLGYGYLNTANGLSTYTMTNFANNFYGYIPELLVYSRVLTPLERRKVETYLAVKYGVSLSDSYIGSDDKLLWDWSANAGFNNRITGIIRDDASGLNQPLSTTSYEEGNYQSDAYDSYQDQNSREKSSRYRLLVIGQAPGNDLKDKNAILWGDDNGALSTQNADGIAGIKRMTRKWKLNTNALPSTPEQKTLTFNNTGLEVVSDFGKSTFKNKITSTTGTSVTTVPLQGSNGYLEFKSPTVGSAMIVKFGTQNGAPSASDYGIRIDASGATYALENKLQPFYLGTIVANYYKITIEKKGNQVYINSYDPNGNKAIATKTLTLAPSDVNMPFYGVVSLEKKTVDVSLTVIHGGFVNTGSQVELSYDALRAGEFEGNTSKSFLIIDRSGTGDFGVDKVDYYPISDWDESRKKLIFNNVIWDADGNGKDVFSFGYRDATVKLIALEQVVAPTCVNGVLQQDGKINIEIKEGLPGYKYSLSKTGNSSVLETGTFYESKKTLSNLAAGDYDLTLEMIGTNFEKTGGTALAAVATTTALPAATNGSIECAVTDFNADKYVGFISQKTTLSTAMLNYGVQIKQNQLYFWNKGVAGSTPLATLVKGSKIKLELEANTLRCSVNGALVGTQNLITADVGLPYFALVALDGSSNGIYNFVHTGFVTNPTKLSWTTAAYINILEGDATASKLIQKIVLESKDCQAIIVPVEPVISDKLIIAPVPSKQNVSFSIYIELDAPSEVTVLIFNTAGVLVSQLRNSNLQKSNMFTTSIATAGMYIVKVLTSEGELSKSIIITQ